MMNTKDRVTIYQVAKAAGVSLATVSRVINKSGTVTPETRERVEKTIAALHYRPSGLAQALATNRTTNIGIIIPSPDYVYISNLLSGLTEVAREKHFVLTLFATSHSRDGALAMIDKVISSHVDGAIVFDDQLNPEDVEKIASYNVPIIMIDKKVEGERIGDIHFSYSTALIEQIKNYYSIPGVAPMTFLHVYNAGRLLSRCEKTFIETHKELGKPYNIVNCDDSYTHTYDEFKSLFSKKENRKGAFICYRDSLGAAVLNAALDSGIKIPEEVEIFSLVGTKYANIFRPTLTHFSIDMKEVGKRAMYMLIDLLNHELVERSAHFEAALIQGGSTQVPEKR